MKVKVDDGIDAVGHRNEPIIACFLLFDVDVDLACVFVHLDCLFCITLYI